MVIRGSSRTEVRVLGRLVLTSEGFIMATKKTKKSKKAKKPS
jgi:hypothetical protein